MDVITDLQRRRDTDDVAKEHLEHFERNMRILFRRLNQMQREADRERTIERVSDSVNRARASFLRDRPNQAKCEDIVVLFEQLEAVLDDSVEGDHIRTEIQTLRREFKIEEDLAKPIENYREFKDRLERVRYVAKQATQQSEA